MYMKKMPGIGLRMIKSSIAVFLCLMLNMLRQGQGVVFYSCIAAVLCMQQDAGSSVRVGKNRVVGTLVGGAADLIGSLIGGNALGTSYWKGGLTRVNERGGEILNLPSGTQIIQHDVSRRVAGGQTVQVYVTVQGNIIGNRQYADELGETIVQRILRALDNM